MNILDNIRKFSILNSFKKFFIEKAYTEGIYADTPANRKLGRVGMSYKEYSEKVKAGKGEELKQKDKKKFKKRKKKYLILRNLKLKKRKN